MVPSISSWRRYTGSHAENVGAVRGGFWGAVRGLVGKFAWVEDAVAMYYCAMDERTPRYVTYGIFAALAYFVCPLDIVSDAIPVAGWADDAAVIAASLALFKPYILGEHRDKARQLLSAQFLHEESEFSSADPAGASAPGAAYTASSAGANTGAPTAPLAAGTACKQPPSNEPSRMHRD